MKIIPEMNNLYCEHAASGEKIYLYVWLGEHTRLCACRLCSTVMLGTVVSSRIKESMYKKMDIDDAHNAQPDQE
jgi:hypothetical protein